MSTSKWAYDPRRCDGQPCPGDCDRCMRWQEDDEEEAYQSAVEDAEFLIDCTPTVIESEEGEGE